MLPLGAPTDSHLDLLRIMWRNDHFLWEYLAGFPHPNDWTIRDATNLIIPLGDQTW